jgi:putative addiction module component (TIGR02574 family)
MSWKVAPKTSRTWRIIGPNKREVSHMTTVTAELADQLLSLPWEDRIYLVDRLLESLNAPSGADIDRVWAEEAERRIEELDSGKVQGIPGDRVFATISPGKAKEGI